MNREQRNRIVIGVAIVAALITGVMIGTAREDDAQGGGAQSALASGDLNESAGGALTSGIFRDIAKAQSPMVVNIRTESRRQTRDLSEFFRGNELLERFFSFPQLPAVPRDEITEGALTSTLRTLQVARVRRIRH